MKIIAYKYNFNKEEVETHVIIDNIKEILITAGCNRDLLIDYRVENKKYTCLDWDEIRIPHKLTFEIKK